MIIKTCIKCLIEKTTTEFSPGKEMADKLNSWCKQCHREYQKEQRKNGNWQENQNAFLERIGGYPGLYQRYKDGYKKRAKKYSSSIKGKQTSIKQHYNYRASDKGKKHEKEYSRREDVKLSRRLRDHQRRVQKKNNGGIFTLEQWKLLCSIYAPNGICPACGNKRKMTVDHVIPVVLNGTNFIENLQPLCKPCNSSKNIKTKDFRFDNGLFASSLMEKQI